LWWCFLKVSWSLPSLLRIGFKGLSPRVKIWKESTLNANHPKYGWA